MPIKMLATKPMSYKTRRLQAGDSFEVKNRQEANVWELVRKTARPDYEVEVKPLPPQQQVASSVGEPDLDALRTEAEAAGVRVDRRWGEARLRAEIASAARQKLPEPQSEPEPNFAAPPSSTVSAMTTTNVGSTAYPVYRRPGDDC